MSANDESQPTRSEPSVTNPTQDAGDVPVSPEGTLNRKGYAGGDVSDAHTITDGLIATPQASEEIDYLGPIRDAIKAAKSTFFVAGEVPVEAPLTMLILPDDAPTATESITCSRVVFPPGSPEDLAPLISACKQASFGRGREEILDPDYRQALVLKKDRFGIIPHSVVDTLVQNILPAIQQELYPYIDFGTAAQHRIVAELDKLNVYGVGDFFKGHVDTPRSESMFGTLPINIPVEHEGGNLVVHPKVSHGDPYTTNWGTTTSFGWIAFFSDCAHEVLPVTSGNRRVICLPPDNLHH